MIKGQYNFKIWKEDDWYLAEIVLPNGYKGTTQGETEEEIFEMIADWIMTANDISCSRWNRFWHSILRLK